MAGSTRDYNEQAVISDPGQFDERSGSLIERLIFNNRLWVILLSLVLTATFMVTVRDLKVSVDLEKMLPQSHAYVDNFLQNRDQLRGLGDSVRVVVENREGDIFNAAYLDTLRKINDELFLLPGVDRAWMKSIWTPVIRWTEVTEEGFIGGAVMPTRYDGSPASIEELRTNIGRAGVVGSLVANDLRSTMIVVPLVPVDAEGNKIDYKKLSEAVEDIRARYVTPESGVTIYVIGFAKLMGDLIEGMNLVATFFGVAVAVAALIIFGFIRCVRSTLIVLACSLIAVLWQLGLMVPLGYGIDPFSMLVPFLVFAIGISHGAQKMNGILQDVARGMHKWVAARYTFRRLFMAGLVALVADAVGFAVLIIIDIPVIRDLALMASLGVAILIFTNLVLLPVLLSYAGVSRAAASRSLVESRDESQGRGLGRLWDALDRFTELKWASLAVGISAVLFVIGLIVAKDLQIGDLDAGAPELRADSRYNMDDSYVTAHYGISSDVFAVMVKTPPDQCRYYETLVEVDRLQTTLAQVPGVQKTESLADTVRAYTAGSFEGNPKWLTISASQYLIDPQISNALSWNSEFITPQCGLTPVLAYLSDHKADTLGRVVAAAEEFARVHSTPDRQFLLAAGNAGMAAVTNIVVEEANRTMLYCVYAAVIALCAITFRDWRAVIAAVLPLVLTSILAEALMVQLDIGVKIATLPVVALGVGIGVDYALYLLSIQLAFMREGYSLAYSYKRAVAFTGKVVGLVGMTLAVAVVTWAASPIKFQADMGIMLTFMFVWNMIGALVLIPALSRLLFKPKSSPMPAPGSKPVKAGH